MANSLNETSHIFISYSRKDTNYVKNLVHDLRLKGFPVWIDDRIDFGDSWSRVIFQKISECKVFIVIMSKDSVKSKWVDRECLYADDEEKRIIPLLLNGKCFPLFINKQYVDVSNGKLPNSRFYDKLLEFFPKTKQIPRPENTKRTISQSKKPKNYTFSKEYLSTRKKHKENFGNNKKTSQSNTSKISTLSKASASKFRENLKRIARSHNPDELITCPICKVKVKSKNIVKHYDRKCKDLEIKRNNIIDPLLDTRNLLKELARNTKPDEYIKCPICFASIKAKNIILHFDRYHRSAKK